MNIYMRSELKEFNRIYKEITSIYHDMALQLGLSDSAFDIFYAIAELGDGCRQRDVCKTAFISKQTVNSSIHKLEKDGYITLEKGSGKNVHIRLTPAGQRFLEKIMAPIIEIENLTFAGMTEAESAELLRLNAKYSAELRKNMKLLTGERL